MEEWRPGKSRGAVQASRLTAPDNVIELRYNPSQPRDSHGRWTEVGSIIDAAGQFNRGGTLGSGTIGKKIPTKNLPEGVSVHRTDLSDYRGRPVEAVVRNNRVLGTLEPHEQSTQKKTSTGIRYGAEKTRKGFGYKMTNQTVKDIEESRGGKKLPHDQRSSSHVQRRESAAKDLVDMIDARYEGEPKKLDVSGPSMNVDKPAAPSGHTAGIRMKMVDREIADLDLGITQASGSPLRKGELTGLRARRERAGREKASIEAGTHNGTGAPGDGGTPTQAMYHARGKNLKASQQRALTGFAGGDTDAIRRMDSAERQDLEARGYVKDYGLTTDGRYAADQMNAGRPIQDRTESLATRRARGAGAAGELDSKAVDDVAAHLGVSQAEAIKHVQNMSDEDLLSVPAAQRRAYLRVSDMDEARAKPFNKPMKMSDQTESKRGMVERFGERLDEKRRAAQAQADRDNPLPGLESQKASMEKAIADVKDPKTRAIMQEQLDRLNKKIDDLGGPSRKKTDSERSGSDDDVAKYQQKLRDKGYTDEAEIERLAQAAARTDRQNNERNAMSRDERIFGGGGDRPGQNQPVATKSTIDRQREMQVQALESAYDKSSIEEVRAAVREQLRRVDPDNPRVNGEAKKPTFFNVDPKTGPTAEQKATAARVMGGGSVDPKVLAKQELAISRTEDAMNRAKPGGAIQQRMEQRLREQRAELAAMRGGEAPAQTTSARPTTEVPTTTGTPKTDPAVIRRQEVAIERTIAARDRAKPGGAVQQRMEARLKEQRDQLAQMRGTR